MINSRPKPVVLIVLDGWGVAPPFSGNAITQANTPFFDMLVTKYPTTTVRASGESVGLPWGEHGNSEVGHLNLGLGRIVYQDLPRINKEISTNNFYKNKALLSAIDHAKKNNSNLHLMGLVSNGAVHSSIEHLQALLVLAKENNIKNVYLHAFLDGRDTPLNSGLNFIKNINSYLKNYNIGEIATVSGRFYAMDRNNHWDRISKAYLAMVSGVGKKSNDSEKAIEASYENKIYDEEFVPTVITKNNKPIAKISDNDSVIFFNFRADRARQITKAMVLPAFDKFDGWNYINNLFFVSFSEYEKDLPVKVAFPPDEIKNTLGEVLSNSKLKQLRIAETEKYAHVTYFFNGGRESRFAGEDHILIPSPQVSSYDEKPEMSALKIVEKIKDSIKKDIYDFVLVNFANTDMIGHTGNIQAAIKAIEVIDKSLKETVNTILSKNGVAVITADHGNAEMMYDMQNGNIDKEHSSNPVPFIIVSNEYEGKTLGFKNVLSSDLSIVQPQGMLSDVAPTILKIMKIKTPPEMTGRSLI